MENLRNITIIICFAFLAAIVSFEARAQREEDIERAIKEVNRPYLKEAEKEAGAYTESPAADIEIIDRPIKEEKTVVEDVPAEKESPGPK